MRLTVSAASLGAFAALLATPALAGDPACLWDALPREQREQVTTAVQAEGPGALTTTPFDQEALGRSFIACGVTDVARAHPAGMALGAYAMERATVEQLERDYGVGRSRLDAAWTSLTPDEQRTMLAWGADPGTPSAAAVQIIRRLVTDLRLPGADQPGFRNTPQARAAATFFLGRAGRLANQDRF